MSGVEVVRSFDRLRALKDDWNALADQCATPLVGHDWFVSCAEALHAESDLRVVAVRRAGRLEGVAPLAIEANPSGRRLTLLGSSRLYEPGGWLFSSGDALATLIHSATRLGMPVILPRIPAESPLCRALPELTRYRAVTVVRAAAPSLGVVTSGAWPAYCERLSSMITSNLARVRRKAERALGPMQVTDQTPHPGQVDSLLEAVVAIEGSGWKGRQGSSLGCQPALRDFFRRYCHRAAHRGDLRVMTLTFGAQAAAVELSVEAYNRRWQLKIGYHEDVAAYYPGLHLVHASIRSAFERGLESYEFLGSAAVWEQRWAPVERHYQVLAVYPFTARSAAALCGDAVSLAWRRTRVLVMQS